MWNMEVCFVKHGRLLCGTCGTWRAAVWNMWNMEDCWVGHGGVRDMDYLKNKTCCGLSYGVQIGQWVFLYVGNQTQACQQY